MSSEKTNILTSFKNVVLGIAIFFVPTVFALGTKTIDIEDDGHYDRPWYKSGRSDEENLKVLIDLISKSSTGKLILQKAASKAAEKGETLIDVLAVGEGSLTDTTLVRKFSAYDPTKVMFETKSKVFVNRYLNTLDASLDLAHELTHYTFREAFNPYIPQFSLKDFIRSTVEGKGGEVDAFLIECKVLNEIVRTKNSNRFHCQKITDTSGELSRDRGIAEFYRIGKHFSDFAKNIEKYKLQKADFPKVTSDEAVFISSAWGVPYPLAAFREYVNIMDRVCKNDYNRLALIEKKVNRFPASSDVGAIFSSEKAQSTDEVNRIQSMYRTMNEEFKGRCGLFMP